MVANIAPSLLALAGTLTRYACDTGRQWDLS